MLPVWVEKRREQQPVLEAADGERRHVWLSSAVARVGRDEDVFDSEVGVERTQGVRGGLGMREEAYRWC